MDFKEFNLHPHVHAGVKAASYVTPTPIQKQAIPQVMAGRDVMGLAQTGTGKTAAFALPILNRLVQNRGKKGVRALIVAPTRELAEQICRSIQGLGQKTRLRTVSVYGGVSLNRQVQELRKGADIVVACPGRLLDHLNQGFIDLGQVETVVLDEADHMFDMGFLPDIRRILRHLPRRRQTLMFSATMPDEIKTLAQDVLRDPVTVQVDVAAPAETVRHALFPVPHHLKTKLLLNLLGRTDTESVLVFTRTKHRAKRLGEQLSRAGYRSTSLQGNLSQSRRQAALDGFRTGRFQILVATDIAARGIDVTKVSHVINFDVPDTPDAYIHRIGRTGRATRNGNAFTLITRDDFHMESAIDRMLPAKAERCILADFDYEAVGPKVQSREPRGKAPMPPAKKFGSRKPRPRNNASPSMERPLSRSSKGRPQNRGSKLAGNLG